NFGVDPGILTKRGYYLVERTWALNRTRAPFTYGTCPKPDDVQIIADTDERTIATAKALNEGLYPGCGYQVRTTDKKHSALFSPLKAKVCKIEYPKELAEKLTERAAGFSKIYGSEIAEVEKILGRELTGKMRGKASKHKVGYEGAPYSAASITEIFALEWGQFPGQKAG
ncbi:histidine-type phosphatase, partial [uncultured Parasutterella sp.]